MTEFREQQLNGARFERVSLRGATFQDVYLNDALIRDVDLTGAQFRLVRLQNVRMRGVELLDVDIYGEFRNLVVNGVDVGPFVEAELNRRMPERAKMRPDTADGFREAWTVLERLWNDTVARARTLPESALHQSVDGEWSFIQTLRHLAFASASWVERMMLGDPSPWRPLELPWDEAPTGDWFSWDRDARPSLDEALALRQTVTCTAPGHPKGEDFPVKECLLVLLNEEWEHRLYAERDLATLIAASK
jgi:hypothetical protein